MIKVSIKTKTISFLTAVMLVTGIIVSAMWYNDTTSLMNKYVEDFSIEMIRNVDDALGYILKDIDYMLTFIGTNDENITKPIAAVHQTTFEKLESDRKIDSFIRTLYGHKYYAPGINVISLQDRVYKVGAMVKDREGLIKMLKEKDWGTKKNGFFVLAPMQVDSSYKKQEMIIPVVKPIRSIDNRILGYVVVYLDYRVIEDMFNLKLPEGSILKITDKDRNMIYSNSEGVQSVHYLKYDPRFFYYEYQSELSSWQFAVGVPVKNLLSGLRASIANTALIYLIIYIIVLSILVSFAYRITNKVTILSHAMEEVSAGNLNVKVKVESNDEITKMSHCFNQMVIRIKELLDNVKHKEKQKREAELDFLQAQINPHFLSNTLNTIVWMANIKHEDNISRLTKSLIGLLHGTMNKGRELIPLYEEVNYIRHYAEIEQYRYLDQFEIDYDIAKNTENLYVLRFIMQPIIENALIHAIEPLEDKIGKIIITSRILDKGLMIKVRDNGIGMSKEQIESLLKEEKEKSAMNFSKIGIKNVNDRIKLFFGKEYGVSFESKEKEFTEVTILLPIAERKKGDILEERL